MYDIIVKRLHKVPSLNKSEDGIGARAITRALDGALMKGKKLTKKGKMKKKITPESMMRFKGEFPGYRGLNAQPQDAMEALFEAWWESGRRRPRR